MKTDMTSISIVSNHTEHRYIQMPSIHRNMPLVGDDSDMVDFK